MPEMKTLTIGNDTFKIVDDDSVHFYEQTLTEEQKAQARANIGLAVAEPAEDDIPKVFFGGALPQTKDDAIMSFRYISQTADISGYCKTKAQGNSSMGYPKKNQTVKLYKDAECTEKLKVDFKGWGEQNKFCFKANWIDLTHARNVVSARLWGDVVKSRSNYAEIPELLRTSPNQGAVDGFPVKVYAEGVYQGRYTLNIPKDAWMANMDDGLDTHCILCGEDGTENGLSQFTGEAAIDGTDWSDEIHDTVPDSIKTRWNEAITFILNSSDINFVNGIGNYFDVPSLIDYYLFGLASYNFDGFAKNQLYMTYDGLKWYASAYDMDATWGLYWDGSYFADYNAKPYLATTNRLYSRLVALFHDELNGRWDELRAGVLSVANIVNEFERFTDICPPWLVAEDYATTTANGNFTEIPLQEANNIQQIRAYIVNRLSWADRYMSGDENLIYRLQNKEFVETTTVDTRLKLFDTAKESTIFVDFEADVSVKNSSHCLLWTCESTYNDPAVAGVNIASAGEYAKAWINGLECNWPSSWNNTWANTRAVCITITADGLVGLCKFKYNNGETEAITFPDDMTFVPTEGVLVLGAKCDQGGFTDMPFVGTINEFCVWDRELTDTEVDALLDGVSV